MAATSVVASLGVLFAAVSADVSRDGADLPATLRALGWIGLGSLIIVTLFALFPGWLYRVAFRKLGMGGPSAIVAAALVTGATVVSLPALLFGKPDLGGALTFAALGAVVGAAAGFAWSLAQPPRRLRDISADVETPRRAVWIQPEPLKVRPVAFVMGLGAIGFAVAVAAAGEGRFDRLPPQQYFAPALWRPMATTCTERGRYPPMDDWGANWYSTHLRVAREPSLYLASLDPAQRSARVYRFTWVRSFHEVVVVRVNASEDRRMRLTGKILSGKGGYGSGHVAARVERELKPDEAARLTQMLARTEALDAPPTDCGIGPDGAVWLLEASDRGAYRFLTRWSPTDGEVREVGLLLISFTGWRIDPVY